LTSVIGAARNEVLPPKTGHISNSRLRNIPFLSLIKISLRITHPQRGRLEFRYGFSRNGCYEELL